MAEIFRRHKPRVLIHMGRIRRSDVQSKSYRFNQNVLGTKHMLELALKHETKRVVVLSTFHVYGAHQHNSIGLKEDSPLRASQFFPSSRTRSSWTTRRPATCGATGGSRRSSCGPATSSAPA